MSTLPVQPSRPALLAVSHGTSSAEGDRAVAALVAAVRESVGASGVAVRSAFVDVQQPDVPTALADLGPGTPGVVVPLLLSAGYHVHVDLARAVGGEVVLADALGPDPRLVTVLVRRLLEAGLRPDDVVVLCAAGSSDARAVADCRAVAAMLDAALADAARAGTAVVAEGTLDSDAEGGPSLAAGADAPRRPAVRAAFVSAAEPRVGDAVRAAREANPGRRVVVATYLLAPGWFATLVGQCGADVVAPPLLVAQGPVPHELVEVVLDRYAVRVRARSR